MPAPILKFKRGNLVDLPNLQAGEPGFTVDKFDLFVGVNSTSSGNKIVGSARYWTRETTTAGSGVNLVEGTNNGTNAITIKSPASLADSQTYIFPGAPTSGGFLRSDGSGNLTWDTGSGFNGGSFPLSALDIDGGTDIGAALVDADEFIVDDGGGGTNRKVDASRIKDYVLGGGQGANFSAINVSGITTATFLKSTTAVIGAGLTVTGALDVDSTSNFANTVTIASGGANVTGTVSATQFTGSGAGLTGGTTPISTLDIDGGTDIGADLVDGDLLVVDDGAGGTNRKTAMSRVKNYVLGGGQGATFAAVNVTGIATLGFVDSTQLKVSGVSTFTGTVDINGAIDADGGANIAGGETTLSSATVSDLTDNRIVVAGTGGALEDSGNLTFDGSTLTVGTAADFNGGVTANTLVVEDLTDNRVLIAGTGGEVEDSGNLTFNGSQLGITGTVNASSTVTASAFHTGAEGSAMRVTSDTISGPATITLDPAGVGDNTGKVVIAGDFQVDGTTTTVNSTTMTVDDKNLELGTGAANDAAANGGGITIVSGEGNKTFNFEATGDNLGSSENLNIASGKVYKVNNVETLSATTLGANVVNSSLTNVGTLTGLSVNGTASVTGQITAGDLRNSDDGLIPLVGVQTASGHSGLVTAFKFRGSGLDDFIVTNGVADVVLTGVAATTYTSRQTHTATQGQTTFTVSAGYSAGFIDVYQNGVRLINGTDYAAENGSTFVMTDAATVGDEFESVAWKTLGNVATLQNLNVVDNLTVTGVTTSGTFVGDITGDITGSLANATVNTLPITVIDIDGATDIGGAIADADLFIVDDGAGGTNRKTAASRVKDYVLGGGQGANFSAISVSGIATATFLKATTATVGAGLTVTGALDVDGGANIASGLTVTGNATINSLKVSDLTNDRVLIAGTSGEIEDSGNLTFNGSTLGVTGGVTASGAIDANGGIAATTAIVEDLTDGRVVLAGSGGELEDHSNLTFDGGTLTVTGASVITSNVTIGGDLTVNGTTSQINTVNMTIEDTLMELQKVDGNNLSSDTNKDVGMVMNYYSGSAKKAAFYWDDSAARFVLAGEASETSGVMTPSAYGGLEVGSLYVNDCAGQSQVISCSGTTRSLENITLDGGSF